ncbi:MAG TPA: hypothetical protein VM324_13745 [Egibacteraceae bacterium]|nr:hypothetical protein [Egibacteraceae bacterium]
MTIRKRKGKTNIDARRCRMCGTTVTVGPDGRCLLGHRVASPRPATSHQPVVEAVSPVPDHEHTAVSPVADPAPIAVSPVADPAPAGSPLAGPPPMAVQTVVPATTPADDHLAHPYDEVLAWEAAVQPAFATAAAPGPGVRAPAPTSPPLLNGSVGELESALGALLSWNDPPPSVLDVSLAELPPAPPPAPPAPTRTEFVDEEAEVAEVEAVRRRVAALLGSGFLAAVAGFATALYAFPA